MYAPRRQTYVRVYNTHEHTPTGVRIAIRTHDAFSEQAQRVCERRKRSHEN